MPATIRLRKTSLVDYPGRVSAVFFFAGCNLRCPWCHNRELVLGGAEGLIDIPQALAHVHKRADVLGAVVLSGGEPCLNDALPDIIAAIKSIPRGGAAPLLVKVDTNGTIPAMLQKLLRRQKTRPDYIALDLKIAPNRYGELGGGEWAGQALTESAALIRTSGIAHEYRTLELPGGFFTPQDMQALAPLVDDAPWHMRPFVGGNCLDPAWNEPV